MNTLQALKAVIETPAVDDAFVIDEVLPKLLNYFRDGTEEEKIHAIGVLSVLAGKNSTLRHDILNAGISIELVNMLKEGNAALKLQVEKLVVDFAEDNPAAALELSDAGAIPEFIGLLRKGTELNFEAGKFLGMLASSTSPQADGLLDGTAVSEFLSDLKIGNERLKSSSGTILRKMARNCTLKQRKALTDAAYVNSTTNLSCINNIIMLCLCCSVIPELIGYLHDDTSNALRSDAMWLLPILSEQQVFRDEIICKFHSLHYLCIASLTSVALNIDTASATALADILVIMRGPDPEEAVEAFWTLDSMSKDVIMRNAIFQQGSIPAQLHHLYRTGASSVSSKLEVLAFLYKDATFMAELEAVMAEGGGLGGPGHRVLVAHLFRCMLTANHASDSFVNSEELLLVLSKNIVLHDICSGFISADAIPICMKILTEGDTQAVARSSQILRQMMQSPLCCELTVSEYLEVLIGLVETGCDDTKIAASRIIAPIARTSNCKQRVLESRLGTVCLALFHHEHGHHYDTDKIPYVVKLIAVQLLGILAEDEATRNALVEQDIIHQLSHLTHRETGALLEFSTELMKLCKGESWLKRTFSGRRMSFSTSSSDI
jgi:hypothetical protein